MAAYVADQGIEYPVAVDAGTVAEYAVDTYPDYYLIDRAGNLRVADLANGDLERAVGVLLAEPAPSKVHTALAEASATATKRDERILVVWGSEAERAAVRGLSKDDAELATLLRNEYRVLELAREDHPALAAVTTDGHAGTAISALRADGTFLAARTAAGLDAAGFRAFLTAHRIPQKDAEVLWTGALARAESERKRVLVHLGAPW